MLNVVEGNLIDLAEQGEFDIIVHGCNCLCAMGSGIAREIRRRCPQAWEADQETLRADMFKLGSFTSADCGNFIVINAYTQFDTAKYPGQDVFEYASFELILRKLAWAYPDRRFGFPRIGMGLAGGDPVRILAMLEKFAQTIQTSRGSATLVEFATK